eukprot:5100284-Pleurochrysis_carterae.AAC.1
MRVRACAPARAPVRLNACVRVCAGVRRRSKLGKMRVHECDCAPARAGAGRPRRACDPRALCVRALGVSCESIMMLDSFKSRCSIP